MGKSRSVAVILVYLLKWRGFSLEQAMDLVKSKRYIAKPNPSYMKQLQAFEARLKKG
jgi:protein-tyrosine phosphatase